MKKTFFTILVCLCLFTGKAWTQISDAIFGDYTGETNISISMLSLNETLPDVTVTLERAGESTGVLKIANLNFGENIDIPPMEMNNVVISVISGGYNLTYSETVNFTIPEVTVPPIPILLPSGGTFYNVPVKASMQSGSITGTSLKLSFKLEASLVVSSFITIPLPINVLFTGELESEDDNPFTEGNGSETNPYVITTVQQLAQLATFVNEGNAMYNDKHYKLGNDIDLSVEPFNSGKGWVPIGTDDAPFYGVFNGDGKKVAGLFINFGVDNNDMDKAGLFGYVYEGTIKNLGVENVVISTYSDDEYISYTFGGAIVSHIDFSTIDNCYSSGSLFYTGRVMTDFCAFGGIAGATENVEILNCHSACSITVKSKGLSHAGGILGLNYGDENKIQNCYSTGSISAESSGYFSYSGGIVGNFSFGEIKDCYSTGSISASDIEYGNSMAGGIVGDCSNVDIFNCYSTGSINSKNNANSNAGGIAGSHVFGSISDCYTTGSIISEGKFNAYAGGISGTIDNSDINNCYSISLVSAIGEYNSFVGGISGKIYWNCTISKCAALNPNINSAAEEEFFGRVIGGIENSVLSGNIAFNNMLLNGEDTEWENIGENNLDGEDIDIESIQADGTLGGRFLGRGPWTTHNGFLPGLFGNLVTMPLHLQLSNIPPTIITTTMPDGMVGEEYYQTFLATGTQPIEWPSYSGELPSGLNLWSNGYISGTPTVAGTFHFTVTALNDFGSDSKDITITIGGSGIDNYELGIKNYELRVFPNPTSGQLTIRNYEFLDKPSGKAERGINNVEIFNMFGKTFSISPASGGRGWTSPNPNEIKLDISHLPAGIYLLKIDNQTIKVIKN